MVLEEVIKWNRTHAQWHEFFTDLTAEEFSSVLSAALHAKHTIDVTLVSALARKILEHAHYSDDLHLSERTVMATKAEAMMGFAFTHLDAEQRAKLEYAWAAMKDQCNRFGYTSGPIWEALRPHHVFRAPNPPSD